MSGRVRVDRGRSDRVARIELDNPGKLNAIDIATCTVVSGFARRL